MIELLSPAGNAERLKTAIYFGADAVYFAGKRYGLRAYSDNFEQDEIKEYVDYCHAHNVKAYITLNIVARNEDFIGLDEYIKYLSEIGTDAVIVSDVGIIERVREAAPDLDIHVSTQANVTNKYSAKFFCDLGVKRIILARELTLTEIKEIRDFIPKDVEIEVFVHGAMCISYSGRCLLSNYLSGRDSNRGECVQACRWEYNVTQRKEKNNSDAGQPAGSAPSGQSIICEKFNNNNRDKIKFGTLESNCKYSISEVSRKGELYDICEDERGTYILNSKDLNMLEHLKKLIEIGVTAFKIEGRMKSPYYVATVTNAYRRALNGLSKNKNYKISKVLADELFKASHRKYTTGFYFKNGKVQQNCGSAGDNCGSQQARQKIENNCGALTNTPAQQKNQVNKNCGTHPNVTIENRKPGIPYDTSESECLESSLPVQTYEFMAIVLEDTNIKYQISNINCGENNKSEKYSCISNKFPSKIEGWQPEADGVSDITEYTFVEQRNRFKVGDTLEILSPDANFNKKVTVTEIKTEKGENITDAKNVQEKLYIKFDKKINLAAGDILRKQLTSDN